QVLLGGAGCHNDKTSAFVVLVLLAHGLQGDIVLREGVGDLGEHAHPILHQHVNVVPGHDVSKISDRKGGVGGLARTTATVDDVASHGDDVTEDGGGGRTTASAVAVEHQATGGLGLDEDGVIGLGDAGQRVGQRDERRVDAGGDTRGAVGLRDAVAQGEQLDGAASG